MLKVFYCYLYYSLSRACKKREELFPYAYTAMWVVIIEIIHGLTILSVLSILTRRDFGSFLDGKFNSLNIILIVFPLGFFTHVFFKYFRIEEKVFEKQMVDKYKAMGCKGWWTIAYYVGSLVALGAASYFEGKCLGLR